VWLEERPIRAKGCQLIIKDDIENARLELARGRFLGFRHKVDKEKAEKHRSTATVNRYLATFKSAFLLAIENEKVTKNPFRKVKLQKENNTRTSTRVRFLTEDEEARLFKVIPSQWHAPVLVALHTGMRFGEQMRLRWEDIDFKQELLTVMESKSGSARHVPLNQIAVSTLRAIPRRLNCPWVFYNDEASMRQQLPRQWEGWLAEAKIENFHWHDLRHTFASRLVMAGVDLYAVKELLGHHSIEMTQRYAHLAPSHLKQAVEALVSQKQVTPELTPAENTA